MASAHRGVANTTQGTFFVESQNLSAHTSHSNHKLKQTHTDIHAHTHWGGECASLCPRSFESHIGEVAWCVVSFLCDEVFSSRHLSVFPLLGDHCQTYKTHSQHMRSPSLSGGNLRTDSHVTGHKQNRRRSQLTLHPPPVVLKSLGGSFLCRSKSRF